MLTALLISATLLADPPPDAQAIMLRVAANQEEATAARSAWVYDQDVFVRLQRPHGKLAREEDRRYAVAPGPTGASRKIVSVEGKIHDGAGDIGYTTAGFRTKATDIDGALIDSFAREVMWKERMGPLDYWFPLTAKRQARYTFKLEGEETWHGYDAWRISFVETDGQDKWQGEALIERNEFQPLLMTADWTAKVPLAVAIGLGTTVKHVGAKITFQRFAKDVWFPVTCGGEMQLRVLFFYNRTIAFSATDSNFQQTDVKSSVDFEPTPQ